MSAISDALAKVPLFRDLDKKAMERLEKMARTRSFKAGDVILKEGDEGVGFFLVNTGEVEVARGGTSLATLGPGQFFGEMALFDSYRRSATVTAKVPTECVAMLRSDFVAEVRGNADLAVSMLSVMARRVHDADERLAAVH